MSTYNKKLPKVSDICFMTSGRTGRTSTLVMPFNGVIPSGNAYVGWKQNSYAYSYQAQYMVTARMTPSKQLQTGSETTKTGWKYFNSAWKGDVNTMNKCVAPDKKHKFYRYYNFAGTSLMTKGSYDKITITVRVRSFNKTKKQHGPWTTKSLTIKCRPSVSVYKSVALADGGIRTYINTNGWTRGDSRAILDDIRFSSGGSSCLTGETSSDIDGIGGEEAADYPYFELPGEGFMSGGFKQNMTVVFKSCNFRTVDGVDVSMNGTLTTENISASIAEPVLSVTRDENKGEIYLSVSKPAGSTDDWDSVSAWLSMNVLGETRRVNCVSRSGSGDETRTYIFMPPMDCEMNLTIGISNDLGGYFQKTYSKVDASNLAVIPSGGRLIVNYTDGTDTQLGNGMFYGSKNVQANYSIEHSTDAERRYETEMPFGRKRPVAFLGDGLDMSVSIKGNIDATSSGEFKTVSNSGYADWIKFQQQQGVVLVRLPGGRTYQALCTKLTLDQEDEFEEGYNFSMTLKEVEV